MADKRVNLGRISTVFGVRGWLKVHSQTEPRENILSYPKWWLKKGKDWQQVEVLEGRPHGKTLIAKLAGVDDRDQAQSWVGATIAVERSQLPETKEDEHYWSDLIGMQVETKDGQVLGKVVSLMETGSNDVLVVRDAAKGAKSECLIPWLLDDVILKVDDEQKSIQVDWDPDF